MISEFLKSLTRISAPVNIVNFKKVLTLENRTYFIPCIEMSTRRKRDAAVVPKEEVKNEVKNEDVKLAVTEKGGKRKQDAAVVPKEEVKNEDVKLAVTQKGGKRKGRQPVKIEIEEDKVEPGVLVKTEVGDDVGNSLSSGDFLQVPIKAELATPVGSPVKDEPRSTGSTPSKRKKAEPIKVDPPGNWKELLENIIVMRSQKTAAVDTMGCERTADIKQEPKVQRFQTLVSLMLSSQTRDQVTYAAMERLKDGNCTVQGMLDIPEDQLAETLKPVGFYKRKATYLKKAAAILREKYSDDIPNTIDDLCSLPGVGPKMAYICMNAAWHENAGIGVDTHVHRISNRLKWTGPEGTSTPEKTREALESWLPKDQWQEINILLVGFGQEICLPIGPKCSTCLNKDICPSADTARTPKKKTPIKSK